MKKNVDLSIIIVNYNTRQLLDNCLKSIFKYDWKIHFKVIVVDNASTDGSAVLVAKQFPQVELIKNDQNIGFAAGNNLALKKINSETMLLLNSDTEVLADSLDNLYHLASNYDISSCQILNKELILQPNTGDFPFGLALFNWLTGLDDIFSFWQIPLRSFHQNNKKFYNGIKEVDWVSGTAMLINRQVVDKIGLLDESFFMYFEDVDYCLRAKKMGFKIGWTDQAKIIHLGGASSQDPQLSQWLGEFKGLIRIYQKYSGNLAAVLIKILIYIFIFLRMVIFALMGKITVSKIYGKILFNL